jgi:hypothetical protein
MSEKGILVTGGNGLVGSCFFDFNLNIIFGVDLIVTLEIKTN